MATQLTSWTPLQPQSGYPGVNALIVSYMGRKEIDLLAGAESPYRLQAIVALFQRFAREDQACLREGFHEGLVELFRENGFSLRSLPVVDLGGRIGRTGCIDFLRLKDMPPGASLARFKDAWNRPGIALHIQGNTDGVVDLWKETPVRSLQGVVAIFKRYNDSQEWYADGNFCGHTSSVYKTLFAAQAERLCFAIGTTEDSFNFVGRILAGTDPAFIAASAVPQIEQPLLAKAVS